MIGLKSRDYSFRLARNNWHRCCLSKVRANAAALQLAAPKGERVKASVTFFSNIFLQPRRAIWCVCDGARPTKSRPGPLVLRRPGADTKVVGAGSASFVDFGATSVFCLFGDFVCFLPVKKTSTKRLTVSIHLTLTKNRNFVSTLPSGCQFRLIFSFSTNTNIACCHRYPTALLSRPSWLNLSLPSCSWPYTETEWTYSSGLLNFTHLTLSIGVHT